ncbi:MAG: pyridoxamine 5'-phosphate oxidase [Flavobacteriaceae bacterium]|nr:pyridoxamine 5'-phosphate oxidase [Flavobacteriaceae bacterium]
MAKELHDHRKSYEKGVLSEHSVANDPFEQFEEWFQDADHSEEVDEANAMTLSSCDANGFPRGRVVLLKEFSQDGFVFYTNYKSEKGRSIEQNNKVCCSFFWPALERQIIIQGIARKTSREQSQSYFRKRPVKSQLGALVSDQSSPIEDREILEKKLHELALNYEGKDVPMPENWGGYRVEPQTIEFWQGRRSRLHDRIFYRKEGSEWKIIRLQP